MSLRPSQKVRIKSAQADALHLGMGWDKDDLGKAHILIESTFGESHPGSAHLHRLVQEGAIGVVEKQGRPSKLYATDICDGIAQGHSGMRFSLLSRDLLAGMVEVHASAHGMDGVLLVSSCDKAIPAHLMAAARINLPSVLLPGGAMSVGPGGTILGDVAGAYFSFRRGDMSEEAFYRKSLDACPGCGACQFMGTASTMQILSEAMGMSLPGSALAPAESADMVRNARMAGRAVAELVEKGVTPRHIITKESLENAVTVHAAVGGSTNAALHLPAIAGEAGIAMPAGGFDSIHSATPFLADIKESGRFPSIFFWYAGGVYRIIDILGDKINLDVLTVSGFTVSENLRRLKNQGFFERGEGFLSNYGLVWSDVIRTLDRPIFNEGAIAVLRGNLAERGAVVKQSGVSVSMRRITGRAVVFLSEEAACDAIIHDKVAEGSIIVVPFQGPRGNGMPEMYLTTKALRESSKLRENSALITDGRFSGASTGPVIGHISPEAARGGAIGCVRDNDLIEIDIPKRSINIIGLDGKKMPENLIKAGLLERTGSVEAANKRQRKGGILALYCSCASDAMDGGVMTALP